MKIIPTLELTTIFLVLMAGQIFGQGNNKKPVIDGRDIDGIEKQSGSKKKVRDSYCYTRAISEYITAKYKTGVSRPDTLFIGKNVDMPDIELPREIGGIITYLISSEDGQKKLKYRTSLVYLNVVGWIEKHTSEFIIVSFPEFKPQHICTLHFKNGPMRGALVLDSMKFEYPDPKN